MLIAIISGLASALFWGATDFMAGSAARAVGTFRAAFYSQAIGFVFLSVVEIIRGRPGAMHAGEGQLVWAILASLASFSGSLFVLQSLATGAASQVAPIVTSYAVVTVILSWLAGEPLTMIVWLGIIGTFIGVTCASLPANKAIGRTSQGSIIYALCGALSHGIGFWLQGTFAIPSLAGC